MRVVVGVSGCIAAYKACELVRLLQKQGHEVRVIMTAHGAEFVGPETFKALTKKPVLIDHFNQPVEEAITHIALRDTYDLLVIAPATGNVVAKLACGIADDLLTSTALAFEPERIVLAPAMNEHMYKNPATQSNLATLRSRGTHVVNPAEGHLACGYDGLGKLASVEHIAAAVNATGEKNAAAKQAGTPMKTNAPAQPHTPEQDFASVRPHTSESSSASEIALLAGKHVLITAGPTHEPIDPVRFVGNYSSGKMGYALAEAAQKAGAQVHLVTGPVGSDLYQAAQAAGIELSKVKTAREMEAAVFNVVDRVSPALIICAAAVADMRPAAYVEHKLKKGKDELSSITLVENPDILAELCESRRNGLPELQNTYVVGFAAETNQLVQHAQEKLARKGCDALVANSVAGGAIFGADSSSAVVYTPAEQASQTTVSGNATDTAHPAQPAQPASTAAQPASTATRPVSTAAHSARELASYENLSKKELASHLIELFAAQMGK